jgi:hypothetical protein
MNDPGDTHVRLTMNDPCDTHVRLASAAMDHCRFRTTGDGSMHVARKMLTDAINAYDAACRAPELVEAYRRKYPQMTKMWPDPVTEKTDSP